MTRIRAAVARGGSARMPVEQLELDAPRDDEVLVRIAGTGVCHTDLRIAEHASRPMVLGHEGAGVIEAVGGAVTGFAAGDRVVMSYRSCGRCRNCRTGHPAYCVLAVRLNFAGAREDGSTPIRTLEGDPVGGSFFGQSSFATHALATENNLVHVPDAVPDDLLPILGPLGCGIQTGAGAVLHSLRVTAGDTVVIAGCGGVGLSAVLAARLAGAAAVIAVDVIDTRLELALELGATAALDGRDDGLVARIRELTDGGADAALDTSANPDVIRSLITAIRPGGTVGVLGGTQPGSELTIDYRDFYTQGRTLTGIVQGDAVPQLFIPRLIDLHLQGGFPFDRLIRRYDFDDLESAVDDGLSGRTVKAVVAQPASTP